MDEQGFIGKAIGNYHITATINSGAYGSVYKAEHSRLNGRIVAIKVLHTYMGSVKEREQFLQEAQFLAVLEHPHILPILDVGIHEGQPYLIAAYAAGGSLRDLLKPHAPLSLEHALSILTQVGQALHYAHQRNIIHRDLKPENILFNAQGNALLADFGIATMLSTASVKHLTTIGGTPPYMAPEQFQGIISKEGDQYALGCIAYELVTGHLPFTAPDFLSMGFKHLTEQPVAPTHYNPQVPAATEVAILKTLAKQRSNRYTDIPSFVVVLCAPFTQTTVLSGVPPTSPLPLTDPAAFPPTLPMLTKEQYIDSGNEQGVDGRYKEALAVYEQAIRLDPKDARAYRNKGAVLNNLGRYKEALAAYEQAIRLDPKDARAYRNKGVALNNLGRSEEALAAYEQAIRLDPKDAFAYLNKGIALRHLGRSEKALAACEQAIRLDPKDARAYRNKGAILDDLGRQREAQEAYQKAQQL